MKILVTGSSGFLGKEVIKALKKKHIVKKYDTTEGKNILDRGELFESLKGIDIVIHLAAIVENDNLNLWEVNVKGTKNLVEEAIKQKVKKIIYLSSTGVYGCPNGKINEKSKTNPENNYEKSKLEAENILLAQQEKICINIIRSAMIFGPNNYWQKMFLMLKKDFPLPLKGENTFQVTPINELINAIELLIKKGKCGEIYLIACEEKISLNKFCEISKKHLGMKNTKIKHIPTWLGEVFGKIIKSKTLTKENIRHLGKERNYNIKKIKKLGYKQKYKIEEQIKKVINELKLN
ncbi:MAG TPA: NAD(P)-dependent oxidoreductase [archaeon]|nr:NAD(P)-dependent oxidoreductase [archaeon]